MHRCIIILSFPPMVESEILTGEGEGRKKRRVGRVRVGTSIGNLPIHTYNLHGHSNNNSSTSHVVLYHMRSASYIIYRFIPGMYYLIRQFFRSWSPILFYPSLIPRVDNYRLPHSLQYQKLFCMPTPFLSLIMQHIIYTPYVMILCDFTLAM